ncbi:hypothetical protein GCM10011322_10380 [Salinarimonas ramus]|uniref:Uncharacterized protein n=1 Tax=Salinarimonas ramus TaxID=690164 RepID=A0A917V2P7_9HYPH|nr:hypothetical protein GCM10011322_10380 [Salinarimonas ramus]
MREAAQELVAAVFEDDRLRHHGAERGHALPEPAGDAAAVEREIGAAGAFRHENISCTKRAGAQALSAAPCANAKRRVTRHAYPETGLVGRPPVAIAAT